MLVYQILGFACVAFVVHARAPSKILSGYDVDDAHFPFFARIQYTVKNGNTGICGGTILSTRYILTAAHCLESTVAQNFSVTIGSNSVYEKVYKVEKLIKHGGSDDGGYHDVGLLRTTEDIVYQKNYIGPVELTAKDYRDDGYPLEVIGYGLTDSGGFPSKLQWWSTTIYDYEKCKAEKETVKDERWICTFEALWTGICVGDSGGPLLADGIQIGIIAHGGHCTNGTPNVYTRIYHYLAWIHEQLSNGN